MFMKKFRSELGHFEELIIVDGNTDESIKGSYIKYLNPQEYKMKLSHCNWIFVYEKSVRIDKMLKRYSMG